MLHLQPVLQEFRQTVRGYGIRHHRCMGVFLRQGCGHKGNDPVFIYFFSIRKYEGCPISVRVKYNAKIRVCSQHRFL